MRSLQLRRIAQILWLAILAFAVYVLVLRTRASIHQRDIGVYDAILGVVFEVAFFVVSGLLIWRKAEDRMAVFTSFVLLLFGGIAASSDPKVPAGSPPEVVAIATVLSALGTVGVFIFFVLFPSGRIVRPWLVALMVPFLVLQQLPGTPPPNVIGALIGGVVIAAPFVIVIYLQVYRYRNISTPVERQQTKWIVYGMGVGFLGFLAAAAFSNVPGPAVQHSIPYQIVVSSLLYGFIMLIPLSIGLAMLRYRLYEIDVLINRTLVYGSLTLSLAALYIGGVIGLEALFRALSGQRSDLAIAVVTLAVAAVFNPWRTRVQRFIDRRFYRHKYDATRTLSRFSSKLRDEVDMEQLTAEVLAVTVDTVQPSSVALWVR